MISYRAPAARRRPSISAWLNSGPRRLTEKKMRGGRCRPQGSAGIARRRLDPQAVALARTQYPSICDAIQSSPAGQTQCARAEASDGVVDESIDNLLGHRLKRSRNVHMTLRQPFVGLSRRSAQKVRELRVSHAQASAIVEISKIEMERSVRLKFKKIVADQRSVFGLAIGRQAHHLVLA